MSDSKSKESIKQSKKRKGEQDTTESKVVQLTDKLKYKTLFLAGLLPKNWRLVMKDEFDKPYFCKWNAFIQEEAKTYPICPPREKIMDVFNYVRPDNVRVVVILQTPYHRAGEADGVALSISDSNVSIPPSLQNFFKEMQTDLNQVGCDKSCREKYDLRYLCKQGVLLINTCLTTRQGQDTPHVKKGSETFVCQVITQILKSNKHVIFPAFGKHAHKMLEPFINKNKISKKSESNHFTFFTTHPSPLGATKTSGEQPFITSKPFSRINTWLKEHGEAEINWIHCSL